MSVGSISLEAILIFTRGVFLLAACGVLAWVLQRWRQEAQFEARRLFEQLDLALVELRALQEFVQRLDDRLDTLSGCVDAGARQAPVTTSVTARGYDLAVRLARRGASIDELIGSCGITRQEAELLARLHSVRPIEPSPVREQHPAAPRAAQVAPSEIKLQAQHSGLEPSRPAVRKRSSLLAVG